MCDIELEVGLEDLRPASIDSGKVSDFFQSMNFGDRLERRVRDLMQGVSA